MEILKDLRTRASLTLRQVEEATGISNAYLSQLENGKIKNPSAQTLYVLSKLYSTSIESLLIASGLINKIDIKPVELKLSIEKRVEQLEHICNNINQLDRTFG